MRLTVVRGEWQRGKGSAKLLDHNGRKCFLGFLALACGYSEHIVLDETEPQYVATAAKRDRFPRGLVEPYEDDEGELLFADTALASDLMQANDDEDMTDGERETELARLGREVGVEAVFVD